VKFYLSGNIVKPTLLLVPLTIFMLSPHTPTNIVTNSSDLILVANNLSMYHFISALTMTTAAHKTKLFDRYLDFLRAIAS